MVNEAPDKTQAHVDSIQKMKNNEKTGEDGANCYW